MSEDVLAHEVERVPIKVGDFSDERSVTRKYMFHPLVFSWEPTFRFQTTRLLMLGYLMCSHRTMKHARDHLWGLLNPYVKRSITREEAKEFMITLVGLATKLPYEYYKSKGDNHTDLSVHTFLKTCKE